MNFSAVILNEPKGENQEMNTTHIHQSIAAYVKYFDQLQAAHLQAQDKHPFVAAALFPLFCEGLNLRLEWLRIEEAVTEHEANGSDVPCMKTENIFNAVGTVNQLVGELEAARVDAIAAKNPFAAVALTPLIDTARKFQESLNDMKEAANEYDATHENKGQKQ
jgi:hypothetical protein